MGISNTIPPSRLIQPGVCTSSTRPTSPFEGQAIYETDTDLMLIWNGTAWVETVSMLTKAPRGIVQLVQSTGTTTATATEAVTLTLPSFTAVANRYYRITYFEPYMETLAANVEVNVRIRMTNLAGAVIARGVTFIDVINRESQAQALVVKTLTAGATVVVATIQSAGGNTYAYGDATYPRQLVVEDIGAA